MVYRLHHRPQVQLVGHRHGPARVVDKAAAGAALSAVGRGVLIHHGDCVGISVLPQGLVLDRASLLLSKADKLVCRTSASVHQQLVLTGIAGVLDGEFKGVFCHGRIFHIGKHTVVILPSISSKVVSVDIPVIVEIRSR